MRKKFYSILFCVLMVVSLLFTGEYNPVEEGNNFFDDTITLHLWYTDDALTEYLNSVALYYYEDTGVRIVPELVSGLEYLENVNEASVAGGNVPDVYLVSNDALGKAYLAGLAYPVKDEKGFVSEENYPKAALSAVKYQDKTVAYPLYYETAVFLCNETYLNQMAEAAVEAEQDAAEGEAAMEAVAAAQSDAELEALAASADASSQVSGNGVSENAVLEKKEQMIPSNIDEILTFADEYDAPETVESILKWDVSDIFYNYFFVGGALSVGGDAGDDKTNINIYNENAVTALKVYQQLNQFFSIEADEITYDSVLQEFIDGKIIFTVATSDAVAKIEQAKAEGKFLYDYAIAELPDINESIFARSLSVTYGAAVNGYSEHREEADDFARYLAKGLDADFYTKTGKVVAKTGIIYENENVTALMQEYDDSVPVPKMLETSNFWINLEVVFTKIWNGEDVDSILKELADQINLQLSAK